VRLVRPRTVRGKILANSVLILSLLAAATLYSGFTSLELDRSVEALFRSNLELEQIETTLDETESHFSEYLRTKSSDSLKDYIKTSTRLSEQARSLNRGVVSQDILLLQYDLTRAFDSYLRAAEAGVAAKRARDIPGYADKFETAGRHAAGARILIADLQSKFLSRSLQAFSTYRSLIPGVLLSDAMLVLAATLLGFSLLWGYSRALTEPLTRLAQAAEAVGRGDYQADMPVLDTHDEIGTLARTFDQMRQGVRRSFQDIQARAEVERTLLHERMHVLELGHRLKDAELVALQTQINPHFLFNTLAAGVELAGTEEASRTEDFLQNLAVFIRYALTPPGRFVAVADEVECVKRYVWLLRLRFRSRFAFDVQVDDNLLDFEIPALILQPLVENSVGHGLADRETGGQVTVRGHAASGGAVLSVRDNGAGMERGEMDAILSEASGELPLSQGIGLRNVIRRILLSTNGHGSVELGGGPGEGLEVKIFLPRYRQGGAA
jgi:sensor histidine kinase YesM